MVGAREPKQRVAHRGGDAAERHVGPRGEDELDARRGRRLHRRVRALGRPRALEQEAQHAWLGLRAGGFGGWGWGWAKKRDSD